MALDGDSQTVKLVKPDPFHRPGLSVGQDHGLADKLSLSLLERTEDRRRVELNNGHVVSEVRRESMRLGVCIKRRASRGWRAANECPGGTPAELRPPNARPMGEQSGGFGLEAGAVSFAGLQPNSRQR